MFWVYVLRNPRGEVYMGQTDNPPPRLCCHNRDERMSGKFTHKNGPWELDWAEEHVPRAAAIARERQIQSMKSVWYIRQELVNDSLSLHGALPICCRFEPCLWSHLIPTLSNRTSYVLGLCLAEP